MQKSYETKQYKKGLKAADAILKKFPDHGGQFVFYLISPSIPLWFSANLFTAI
jgi:outer membrane protein assembly factor BamD (BamD/ComL family)